MIKFGSLVGISLRSKETEGMESIVECVVSVRKSIYKKIIVKLIPIQYFAGYCNFCLYTHRP